MIVSVKKNPKNKKTNHNPCHQCVSIAVSQRVLQAPEHCGNAKEEDKRFADDAPTDAFVERKLVELFASELNCLAEIRLAEIAKDVVVVIVAVAPALKRRENGEREDVGRTTIVRRRPEERHVARVVEENKRAHGGAAGHSHGNDVDPQRHRRREKQNEQHSTVQSEWSSRGKRQNKHTPQTSEILAGRERFQTAHRGALTSSECAKKICKPRAKSNANTHGM